MQLQKVLIVNICSNVKIQAGRPVWIVLTMRENHMDLKKLFNSNKAVSPVIGVVLMVAITVILAAAVGSSVFGQGPAKSAPQANINVIAVDTENIKLEHNGGDTINFDPSVTKIMFEVGGTSYQLKADEFSEEVATTEGTTTEGTTTYSTFDVGMTKTLALKYVDDETDKPIEVVAGNFATVKIVDVKTKQLIAQKELRF